MISEDDQTDEADITKTTGDYQVNGARPPNGDVQMEMMAQPAPDLLESPENPGEISLPYHYYRLENTCNEKVYM